MNRVLDACAMIALLRGESGGEVVEHMLVHSSDRCFAHAVNLCEVCYDFIRAADVKTARAAIRDLRDAGVQVRKDLTQAFWRDVGESKATIRRISLADCFAMTLARRLDADVVTSDHHEFDPLAAGGICRVTFIR